MQANVFAKPLFKVLFAFEDKHRRRSITSRTYRFAGRYILTACRIRMKNFNFSIFNPRNDLLRTFNFYREPTLIEIPYILPLYLKLRTHTPKSCVPPLHTLDIVYELSIEGKRLRNTYSIIVVTCEKICSLIYTNSGWFCVGIIVRSLKDEICNTRD